MILLNPGPANTTNGVKQAQVVTDICPRETVFGDLCESVASRLAAFVDSSGDHVAVLFGGSGTASVEAAIASFVPPEGRLLVVDNGAYGARITAIAKAYALPHDTLEFGVGTWPDLDEVESKLASAKYTHLAVIHHETTTGMLNPVPDIAKLARARGVKVLVDAMSSYAGIPIEMNQLGADVLVSSSNKCIQGMAGLSFVIAKRGEVEALKTYPGRSLYLNVGEQHRFFKKSHQMRFTPPVQTMYALAQAIDELETEGGVEARLKRYMACFDALDGGMRKLGFARLLPEEQLSKILTAYVEPSDPNYSYDKMHDLLFERGFTIYPGKGAKQATFRLANMGDITPEDMHAFARAMREVLEEMRVEL